MAAQSYVIKINNGVEAFGTEGKTITTAEKHEICDAQELAMEMAHHTRLLDEDSILYVLSRVMPAIAQKCWENKRVQLPMGNGVAISFYCDVTNACGKGINEEMAQELGYEEITEENAAEILQKAGGVKGRLRADIEPAFQKEFDKLGFRAHCDGVKEVAYIQRKEVVTNNNQGGNNGGNNGDNNGGGSDDNTLG